MSFQVGSSSSHKSGELNGDKSEIALEESSLSKIDFHRLSPASAYYSHARNFYYTETEKFEEKPRQFSRLAADDSHVQCELMLFNKNPVGMIVHRKMLRESCPHDGARNIFEVELCELFNKEDVAGYGRELVDRVISLGEKLRAESVHLSRSEKLEGLAHELKARGFTFSNERRKDHLYLRLNSIARGFGALAKEAHSLSQRFEAPRASFESQDRKRKRSSEEEIPANQPSSSKPPEEKRARQDGFSRNYERSQSAGPLRSHANEGIRKSHELTLRKMYIHQIRNGQKTVEGRIFSGVVLKYSPGDKIRFFYHHDPHDDVRCTITKIERFGSFREMLEKVGYKKCLAEVHSLFDAIRVYDSIPNYRERAEQHGVAAIHLTVD